MSEIHLVVTVPFGGYDKGDRITDAAKVAEILEGENSGHVLKVPAVQEEPAEVPAKKK